MDGSTLVAGLPPWFIEMATSTVWDERATEALEDVLVVVFDEDGDGDLNDLERIAAVRSMRDAAWPGSAGRAIEPGQGLIGGTSHDGQPSLSEEDRRLHHDVDESRRRERAGRLEAGEEVDAVERFPVDAEFHLEVVERFRLVDDGTLAAAELAGFLRHYRARSEEADLNLDGRVDERDLRLFLDVAQPLGTRS